MRLGSECPWVNRLARSSLILCFIFNFLKFSSPFKVNHFLNLPWGLLFYHNYTISILCLYFFILLLFFQHFLSLLNFRFLLYAPSFLDFPPLSLFSFLFMVDFKIFLFVSFSSIAQFVFFFFFFYSTPTLLSYNHFQFHPIIFFSLPLGLSLRNSYFPRAHLSH